MGQRLPIGRITAWTLAILAVLIAALVTFFLTFDWNRARPWVDDKVSQAIGRQFHITGDLKVGWRSPPSESGWRRWVPWPRFSAQKITIANPDWASQPQFATLDEIDFEVEPLPLLARDIVIPTINLVNPSIDLERVKDNRNNWTFKFKQPAAPSTWNLKLHDIACATGHVAYTDQITQADMQVAVDTLGQPVPIGDVIKQQEQASRESSAQVVGRSGASKLHKQIEAKQVEASAASAASPTAAASSVLASPASASANTGTTSQQESKPSMPYYGLGWTVKGTYKQTAVSGSGKVGGVLALQDTRRPFPVQANVKIGDTHIALAGTVTDPAHLAALDLKLWLQGVSMADLYPIAGVPLPETPPYATEGRLVGQFAEYGNVFKYENFTGRVGGSDLNGSMVYADKKPRPLLTGELVSNLLQFSDLTPIIGADTNASKAKRGEGTRQPSSKALPVEQFKTDRWKAIDADVKFTGRRIIKDPALPITDLYTHVIMTDGVLTLEPLKFGVAGGTLASNIHLDGSAVPLKGRFSTQARHLKLKQLFPTVKTMQSALGEVNGDAELSATGNSPAALAATSNGEVKALITDGTISRLYMEAAGLNVANVVYEKLFGNRDVKINCAAADFVVTNGVLESRVFALDTDDAVINMDGRIDLRTEQMDLGIHPHTKGVRVVSLRSPLYAKGTFKNPDVGVDAGALAVRGGAVVGLGLVNPFAALIPLIVPSNNKPLPCAQMLADMRTAPSAPPAGQKQREKAAPAYLASGAAGPAEDSPGGAARTQAASKTAPAGPAAARDAQYRGR
ncbi:AsmA family protein [Trinickia mobilis]|uniref:AsmA family protein n=1 Tax=Trinickia mobilis TaxID=2816356 RepID=UPI001A8EE6BE|nr:AsmA family protein [Trinickia mobilis]